MISSAVFRYTGYSQCVMVIEKAPLGGLNEKKSTISFHFCTAGTTTIQLTRPAYTP